MFCSVLLEIIQIFESFCKAGIEKPELPPVVSISRYFIVAQITWAEVSLSANSLYTLKLSCGPKVIVILNWFYICHD